MRTMLLCVAVLGAAAPAQAASSKFLCNNGPHDYLVTFDPQRGLFRAEGDNEVGVWTVYRVGISTPGYIVEGRTNNGGPLFKALLARVGWVKIMEGTQVVQTDPCRGL